MSTRSTTHFIAGKYCPAIIYRHSDGYPEGAGVDLRKFLAECATLRDTRLNDPSYLAARYVVFLAQMFNRGYEFKGGKMIETVPKSRLDFISVGVVNKDPGDIEYRYVVDCESRGPDGMPSLKCFEVSETWDTENQKDRSPKDWKLTEVPIPALEPQTTA
jgi:hypothetical protein